MVRRHFSVVAPLVLIAGLWHAGAVGALKDPEGGLKGDPDGVGNVKPPVLRNTDIPDTAIVTLPGPAPEPVVPQPAVIPAAVIPAQPVASVRDVTKTDETRPYLKRVNREYPPGFEQDTPKFLQDHIGQWRVFDVTELLGQSLRHRPSFDEDGKENGMIHAFADPTGRNKEFELDFSRDTGTLRTVFIYPLKLTWQACRQTFGSNTAAAVATQGRKFYSYLDRRLDVLVDASGRVISLGLY